MNSATYTDEDFVRWDPFEGNDRGVEVRMREVKVVTVRKPQNCYTPMAGIPQHPINPGERARVESGLVMGEWGRFYVCVACMERWLKDCGIPPAEVHDQLLESNHSPNGGKHGA